MNWIANQETSVEQVVPCMFFCGNDLISTSSIIDRPFLTGSPSHLIYFWLHRMDKVWKKQPIWLKWLLLLFMPMLFYIAAFGLAAGAFQVGMMVCLFTAIMMVFIMQAIPLIPFPLFPGYAIGRHHKWNSAGSIMFGFCVFALVMYALVFVLEYFTAAMNSRTNNTAPQGTDTFFSQYLSIIALGAPFVAMMTLTIHETTNDLPNYFPINPVYYIHDDSTPLHAVRHVLQDLRSDVNDTSYEKRLMERFFRNGGAHRTIPKSKLV